MGTKPSFEGIARLIMDHMDNMVRTSQASFAWDISNGCEAPVRFSMWARPNQIVARAIADLHPDDQRKFEREDVFVEVHNKAYEFIHGGVHPLGVDLTVPCRKCQSCLLRRARLWAHKCKDEIMSSPRTWFATYTATPEQHYRWLAKARMNRLETCAPFDAENSEIEFAELCAAAGPDITRYVKRIRKESGARIRYIIVAERHLSGGENHGLPHWHALIHETPGDKPIRKAVLKGQWHHGFSRFKLIENPAAAWYVCKYLSKDAACRIRASVRYGKNRPDGLAPIGGVKQLATPLLVQVPDRAGHIAPPRRALIPPERDIHRELSA